MRGCAIVAPFVGIVIFFIAEGYSASPKKGEIDEGIRRSLTSKIMASFGERALVNDLHFGRLSSKKSHTISLPLPSSGCYLFAVVAENSATDLSLSLSDEKGEIARDRLSGKLPSTHWCTSEPTTVTAEVFMYGGKGAFALAVFFESGKSIPSGIYTVGDGQSGFVANRIRQLHTQFGGKAEPVSPVMKGYLGTGEARFFDVELTAACIAVVGAGGPHTKRLNVSLTAADGKAVGAKSGGHGFVTFDSACPLNKGVYRVRVEMVEGRGDFGVQLFAKSQ